MPRNGSGVYSLPAGSTATTGNTILASTHNTPLNDIETDMNTARPIVAGGTGATSASAARTNLGLGSIATQASSSVTITGGSITGITDLAVADGGTGASTAADARTNLGLGSIATQAANSVNIDGGAIDGTPIGANSASTGAFTTLTATGDITFDTTTLFVDSSANEVGIGTTSPASRFTVYGDGTPLSFIGESGTTTGGIAFRIDDGSNTVVARINGGGSAGNIDIEADPDNVQSNSDIDMTVDGTSLLRLSSGNVFMPNLPTSDPLVANALWNDSGTIKVSSGP